MNDRFFAGDFRRNRLADEISAAFTVGAIRTWHRGMGQPSDNRHHVHHEGKETEWYAGLRNPGGAEGDHFLEWIAHPPKAGDNGGRERQRQDDGRGKAELQWQQE